MYQLKENYQNPKCFLFFTTEDQGKFVSYNFSHIPRDSKKDS